MDTTLWDELKPHYASGNIWVSAYTPHDMLGTIRLFYGATNYESWLDNTLNTPLQMAEEHTKILQVLSKNTAMDEPEQQIPYLYNFAGKPWKTQNLVRKIMRHPGHI